MHSQREPHPDRAPARLADSRLRVGDAERGRVVDQLADHHAAGRLTLDEFEERMSAAWTARTGGELEVLVRDLPAPPGPSRPASRVPARPRLTLDSPTRTYLAVIALLWVIWLVTGAGYPWPVWPMLGWGIGVAGRQRGAWAGR
jgi:Domain of unknown function (DUF1707)/2TM domain